MGFRGGRADIVGGIAEDDGGWMHYRGTRGSRHIMKPELYNYLRYVSLSFSLGNPHKIVLSIL